MRTGRLLSCRNSADKRANEGKTSRWALRALAVVAATAICNVDAAQAFSVGGAGFRPSLPSIRPSMPSVNAVGVRGGIGGGHVGPTGTGHVSGVSADRPHRHDEVLVRIPRGQITYTDDFPSRKHVVHGTDIDVIDVPSGKRLVRGHDSGPSDSNGNSNGARGVSGVPPTGEQSYVSNEVVAEFVGTPTNQTFNAIAARYRLNRIDTQRIGLTDSTWVRWRIADRRSVPVVIKALEAGKAFRSVQPNYLFAQQQDKPAEAQKGEPAEAQNAEPPEGQPAEQAGDSAQYALAKLHLPEAQAMTRGNRVVVAVIDTEIDKTHPEFAGTITESFDALGVAGPVETHGTGIAGIIAAHAKLLGAAPEVRILAIRAFGSGIGTTFSILKGLDYAVAHDARVINMSFAGPNDPALGRALTAAHAKGRILIAAVGNKGPKSPPLFPAADPNVIGVTATDAKDRLFEGANRGDHVAIAAPGVDILVAAPGNTYAMSTGTSFASAYVAGVAALLAARKPDLTPDAAKNILMSTAHDLGPQGRDAQFGAGLMDANQALLSLGGRPAAALARDATH
jgi:hypothetical protein